MFAAPPILLRAIRIWQLPRFFSLIARWWLSARSGPIWWRHLSWVTISKAIRPPWPPASRPPYPVGIGSHTGQCDLLGLLSCCDGIGATGNQLRCADHHALIILCGSIGTNYVSLRIRNGHVCSSGNGGGKGNQEGVLTGGFSKSRGHAGAACCNDCPTGDFCHGAIIQSAIAGGGGTTDQNAAPVNI